MGEVNISVTPVIEIQDISVSFEGFKALTDVTTKIMPHKVHFFIGPNGAGKTTLLDIICGKTRPSNGKIIYHGGKDLGIRKFVNIDLTKLTEAEIVAEGIGRKFQAPSVFTSLTVWENME
ncbi:MAG: ATP-binding cassette domain-containing protein, partial [Treponema sp.]|nr:ATP-binding cassette domain-containing protein [Treponema sp.]